MSLFLLFSTAGTRAASFLLPTANHALHEKDGGEKFLVGTVGKPWTSGGFGCVRTDGWQMHEGLDIRCLQRDGRGEPADSVLATADGEVAYINHRPNLSNYGNYLILRHRIEGLDLYSLYAHLREFRTGLKLGQFVKAGEPIAVMGRTSNTRQRISLERAHVHFELNFLLNDRYAAWHKLALPGERNDHGEWNGLNLAGIDPRAVLLAQRAQGDKFSLVQFIRQRTELCRVLVRDTKFPWLQHCAPLLNTNPIADKQGVAGYELALDFNGVAFQFTPRAPSEMPGQAKFQLLSVNEAEQQKNPCRRLVTKKGARWQLTAHGEQLLQLLTY